VIEADNQAGVFGAVEGDLQSMGLAAVHYEGQFEGQNGARGCLSEPVSACVS
jgi:hypothetical protein